MTHEPPSIETIRERMAATLARKAAEAAASPPEPHAAKPRPRRKPAGVRPPMPDATRERMRRDFTRQEQVRRLADDDLHRLVRRRLEVGLSQTALAEKAFSSRRVVQHAEAGDRPVSAATWRRLAHALGCDVDEIKPG